MHRFSHQTDTRNKNIKMQITKTKGETEKGPLILSPNVSSPKLLFLCYPFAAPSFPSLMAFYGRMKT